MVYVELLRNFLLADSGYLMAVRVHFGLLNQKTFDSYFLGHGVRRVHEKYSSRRFERTAGS